MLYFFPGSCYIYFLIVSYLSWFRDYGLGSGFWGTGKSFELMGFGAYGVGPSWFFGVYKPGNKNDVCIIPHPAADWSSDHPC